MAAERRIVEVDVCAPAAATPGTQRASDRSHRPHGPRAPADRRRPRRWPRAHRRASSSTTCALVPPKPNELTPAQPARARAATAAASGDHEARAGEGDVRVELAEVDEPGNRLVLQRQHDLDQAGDAGGRLQMADVGLDRAEQRSGCSTGGPAAAPRPAPRPRSDRPAGCRCRAPRRRPTSAGARRRRRRSASRITACWAGRSGAVRPLVRPSWLTADPRITAQTRSPSATRVGQPLEHDHAAAFAADEAVGARRRRSCSGRRATSMPSLDSRPRSRAAPASGSRRRPAPARTRRAQALAGQVDGDQRRRAGRVDGQARPAQVEQVRQPVRPRCCARCRCGVGVERRWRRRADASTRSRSSYMPTKTPVRLPASALRRLAGVLERLPGHLEQQPLLRVHARRLARRDAEEAGSKRSTARRKPPQRVDILPARLRIRRRRARRRPSDRRAPRAIASTPSRSSRQNASGRVGAAGKPAADADDGDGLPPGRRVGSRRSQTHRQQSLALRGQRGDPRADVAHS